MKCGAGLLLIFVLLPACFAAAQVPRSHYDPAAAGRRPVQQKSFIEWALGRINPRNIDYGARIEETRQSMLDDTIRDPEWRAKALLMAALVGLFIAYWWELRTSGGLRVSTTRIITAYHNELAVTRDQISKLTAEHGQAKRALDDHMEMALAIRAARGKREDGATNSKKVAAPADASNSQLTVDQLVVENNSLKQQVKTLTAKWQEEQQRNRKLKGE